MTRPTPGARTSGRHLPVWLEGAQLPPFPSLHERIGADVCVVGAGIAGLTTAYLLRREGRDVVVVEDGRIASGESGRSTAHVATVLATRWSRLEVIHGEIPARLAAESHARAIERVDEIVREERIACGFSRVDGWLFAARPEHHAALEEEMAAAQRAGLVDVSLVPRVPAGAWDSGPALRFPRQARLDPARYLAGLARAFVANGGRIFCGTRAEAIDGGKPARVAIRGGGAVDADAVVVATNAPVSDRFRLPAKQSPCRTYVVGLPLASARVGPDLLWDTEEPYHYVRTADGPEGPLLLVGGEDHPTGHAGDQEERFARLEKWARARFPVRGEAFCRWSGQVMEPADGLALIGADPEDETRSLFVATGHSGNGVTYGTIAGMLLTEMLEGRRSQWGDLYDPSRRTLGAFAGWAKRNLGLVSEYGTWMTGGDVEDAAAIRPGHGAVVRKGIAKAAIYRDARGTIHERSAICPHLGCLVHWNAAERSWDCPCHGSRFDALGTAMNGPSRKDLAEA